MLVVETVTRRRGASALAWAVCAVSIGMVVGALIIGRLGGSSLGGYGAFGTASLATFSLMGGLIAARRPENPIGWIFCAIGLSFAVATLTGAWSDYAVVKEPGALPLGPFMAWIAVWAWPPGILLLFTFLLLLFPDGRLPSRRWRAVAWLAGAVMVTMVVPIAIAAWPIRGPLLTNIGDTAPAAAPDSFKLAYNIQVASVLAMFVLGLASAVSLILRMRRATGDERLQIKWFAFAAAVMVVVVILASPLFGLSGEFQVLAFPLLPIASAVAILKHRLYDIDVVISKTVVFTTLAAFVTAVYLAVVVGIGAVIGTTGNNVVLSIVATAIVAAAFQPLRERARRLANRLVYGKRATPYEVLADFAERVGEAYSAEDVLPRMARILGEGTGATRSEVWLRVGRELRRSASWPTDDGPMPVIALQGDDGELPAFPEADRAVPVRHQGDLLGALSLTKPPNEPLAPTEEKLLADLASQAGLVLRNVRLTADLRARLEELRTSRERLVTAQDEERRKLERNLHDGAQQQLVALAVKARLADAFVGKDAEKERAMLGELQEGLTDALDTLRDLARGIYPPLLADKGLMAAIEGQARKSPLPIEVTAERVLRYAQETEAAVYFCCLEALQNVAKYANASRVTIRLWSEDGELLFSVTDDGRGFDKAHVSLGAGLQNMSDRLAALGGSVELESEPGRGTTVTGRVPARAIEAAVRAAP
jgi:signal transduction histidine kinase